MSKKTGKPGPIPDTTLSSGEAQPLQTIYEQLEQSVWNLSSSTEQYEAFTKAFNYHMDGICHEAILSEELFLIVVQCRKIGIHGNRLGIVVDCLKSLFELLAKQHFQTPRQAFDWVCDNLKQNTNSGEVASAPGNTNAKLTEKECLHIIEYISESILQEFDLFAAVFGYPMDHEIMEVTKRLPTPVPAFPPLASAVYDPIKEAQEAQISSQDQAQEQTQKTQQTDGEVAHPLDETKERIISRMVELDVSRAKEEVTRTIGKYRDELEARLKATT